MTTLEQQQQQDALHLKLRGRWVFDQVETIRPQLAAITPVASRVVFDARDADRLDITAAWFVYRQAQQWRKQGREVEFAHFPAEYLNYFTGAGAETGEAGHRGDRDFWRAPVSTLGKQTAELLSRVYSAIAFFGRSMVGLVFSLFALHTFRFRAVFHHVFTTGISAVPIVGLIACLISIVITYQGGASLKDLGVEIYTVELVAVSVLRELGVLLTAIMVAGRSGSAFAAEIGLMKSNQEVDALRVMGGDPFLVLVTPRLVALVIALPLLTILANIVALVAAALISSVILDISFTQFFAYIETWVDFRTFAAGLIKAPFFAVVIAFVGCWQGMQVTGSSESLGEHTTQAVVDSIFLVLLLDALFSILFYQLGF